MGFLRRVRRIWPGLELDILMRALARSDRLIVPAI
jgi:hypothetical protein